MQVTPSSCNAHRDGVSLSVKNANSLSGGRGFPVGYEKEHYVKMRFVAIIAGTGIEADYESRHKAIANNIAENRTVYEPSFWVGTCSFASDFEVIPVCNATVPKILTALVGPNKFYESKNLRHLFGMHVNRFVRTV